jgi:alkyldihydroxyacetonephosphate synthase
MRTRSWWGWGWDDEAVEGESLDRLAAALRSRPGFAHAERRDPPAAAELDLPAPRLDPPAALADRCAADPEQRAGHAYGKAFRDVVRGIRADVPNPPDVVALPRDEADVAAILEWAADAGAVVVPYGRGSSVVGGVEYRGDRPWVSLDLTSMAQVLEVDRTSRAARIQAGVLGPALEDQLRPHDLTLRHYPQSFEHSTLGGWLATRSGGHFATGPTHIDDFVESIRTVTPRGVVESRRLPGSGAGPSPDRLLLGSEGILGVITEAWLRLQDRPRFKASASVRFDSLAAGVAAARAVAQAGLWPANCRLLDPGEAAANAGTAEGEALLVLGFESADHPLDAWIARAVELCEDHGGRVPDGVRTADAGERSGDAAAETWRSSFLRAPYGRDAVARLGCIAETFETACTWDGFDALHADVVESVTSALQEVCGGGTVTCRFTHVYPDGCAPYFTVLAPSRHGDQVAQWDDVKAAAGEAITRAGGTITHHHAVGRDHRPWYDRQRPDLFAEALAAAKHALDPAGVLNPGVLIDG